MGLPPRDSRALPLPRARGNSLGRPCLGVCVDRSRKNSRRAFGFSPCCVVVLCARCPHKAFIEARALIFGIETSALGFLGGKTKVGSRKLPSGSKECATGPGDYRQRQAAGGGWKAGGRKGGDKLGWDGMAQLPVSVDLNQLLSQFTIYQVRTGGWG